jgi:biotin transport system substrate-specific component
MSSIASPLVPERRVLADLVVPSRSRATALAVDAAMVVAGAAFVAVLAQLAIPMWPVPITGQTLGVLLVGAGLGALRGASSLGLYAVLGLVGLPVGAPQADGSHLTGAALFASPTFGYIVGFVLAAAVVGALAERTWDRRIPRALVAFVAGSLVIYAVGLPWLAVVLATLGVPQGQLFAATIQGGLLPFLVGDAIKAVFAGLLLPFVWKGVKALDARKG